MRVRKITMPVYFSIVILYLEMVFHIYEFRSLSGGFFFMTLFSVMGGVLIGALIGKMRERAAYIVTIVVTAVLCLFFCAEIVYKSVFQKFLALFSMLGVAGQAFDFMDVIGKNVLLTIGGLILLWLPMIFLIIGKRKNVIVFRQYSWKESMKRIALAAEMYLAAILILGCMSQEPYSLNDIYYHNVSTDLTVEQFGVLTTNRLDAWYQVAGKPMRTLQMAVADDADKKNDKKDADGKDSGIDTSPNIMDIDFDGILAASPNDSVTQLTQYFQAQSGTNKNEYTGMFEGYNVIFITARRI